MKTSIRKLGDSLIVTLEGQLSHEEQASFRDQINRVFPQNVADSDPSYRPSYRKIIFDFEKLDFVGSSGISTFVQTLREFGNRTSVRPEFRNLKNEFRRVFRAFDQSIEAFFFDDIGTSN